MKSATAARLNRVLRWALGILMIWAAIGKIADTGEFLVALRSYELPLPDGMLRLTAVILPWLELICGLSLLAGFWLDTNLAILSCLMIVFLGSTGQAWIRGLDISCGCFGSAIENETFLGSVSFAVFRNLILAAVTIYLWVFALRQTERAAFSEDRT